MRALCSSRVPTRVRVRTWARCEGELQGKDAFLALNRGSSLGSR